MSNETNWTPGPWRKAQTDKGRPKVVDRNGVAVATAGAQPYNHDDFILMSAAPELYEALQLADAEFSGANIDILALERKIRAALAKARGEQP